jgi:hypothetical protein
MGNAHIGVRIHSFIHVLDKSAGVVAAKVEFEHAALVVCGHRQRVLAALLKMADVLSNMVDTWRRVVLDFFIFHDVIFVWVIFFFVIFVGIVVTFFIVVV